MRRLQIVTEIRRAIEQHEFCLWYQPIVDLETGRLAGFEALIRWQHPQRGFIAPDEFIPIAEETGMIILLGQWVLYEACRQLRHWQEQTQSDSALTVNVNLSGKEVMQPDLIKRVRKVLDETGLDPTCLKLEITESVAMQDAEATIETMRQLRAMGIHMCVDDFGTGFSSLQYLNQFPIQMLKIDRSFVGTMDPDSESIAIVKAIILLAHALNIDVVAEGVETIEHLVQLQGMGCEYGQGYLFAQALDSDAAGTLFINEVAQQQSVFPPETLTEEPKTEEPKVVDDSEGSFELAQWSFHWLWRMG
ncbi:MAG: EAL domain-containing protein [Chloroflexaceae bacterium]|nr:EAL domain-containing protein [Chloroflexaceae bacterium]